MKDWTQTEAPKGAGGGKEIKRWDSKTGNEWKFRLIGPVIPRFIYWVVTKEGKKRTIDCLSFDSDTEKFVPNAPDPVKELPEEAFNEKPQFAYVCQGVMRGKNREQDQLLIIELKSKMYGQIVALAKNPEYGNPADPVNGYDLTVKKNKTGPQIMNVEYVVTPGRNSTPLSETELALDLFDLSKLYKRPTYEEQRKWLMDNTSYYADNDETFKPEGSSDI